ncbi:MAG TPA: HNH endonuclease, partial [Burkholderiales bacterium]|nr:HNH endonuclease [Burkholderiales bacterium]
PGFSFEGRRVALIHSRRAICKPSQMRELLSIKTAFPIVDGKVWYDDPRAAHADIYAEDISIDCTFSLGDSDAAQVELLHDAIRNRVPIIYFLAASPRRYQAIFPTYVMEWDAAARRAKLAFGFSGRNELGLSESIADRRVALGAVKRRLYQASFREAVITAYKGRCAISGLAEPQLLDVAHITANDDVAPGRPVVTNGIPLSRTLRAAFDSHLIGIDTSLRVHVSDRKMAKEGVQITQALERLNHARLHLPDRHIDRPDRDRIATRFEDFLAASSVRTGGTPLRAVTA